MKLTIIIPTFNEQANIQRALDSAYFADEIIVVDSFSTDRTIDIVNKSKATLYKRKFDDFSNQKNFAISKASNQWIFLLDADEEITDALKSEILTTINFDKTFASFYVYRNFFFKEKKLNFSGWQRDKVIRLFKRDKNKYVGKVHEVIKTDGKVGFLKQKLNHYSYKNYHQYVRKLKHYAKLQAQELKSKGKKATLFHLLLKPFIRFFIQFFIKLGFLDGWRGFVICFAHSYGVFLRYIELYKLKNSSNRLAVSHKNSELRIGFDAKRIFHNKTGLGNYSRDLVRILANFYPENSYVLYNPKPKRVQRLKLTSNMQEVLPTSKFWKKLSSLWRQKAISKQILNDGVQIYHGLSGELPLGLSSKVTKIVTIHDLIFVRYPQLYSFFDRKIHFYKFKYACKVADVVIAISEQTKKDIIQYLGIPSEKIKVIYQGCHQVFKEEILESDRNKVLAKYNLPNDFVLNVGTIQERKNALTIVKAIKDLDIDLVLVGSKTTYFNKIQEYLDKHNLNHRVHVLEKLSLQEISSLYQQAKLSVYPSIFEGFGIPIIESMYCKTPVITTKGGVFPEAAGEGALYLENPLDEIEMKKAIESLLTSTEKLNELACKGYLYVQKFNDEEIAKQMMNLYYKTKING